MIIEASTDGRCNAQVVEDGDMCRAVVLVMFQALLDKGLSEAAERAAIARDSGTPRQVPKRPMSIPDSSEDLITPNPTSPV